MLGLAQDNTRGANTTADNGGLIRLGSATGMSAGEAFLIGHDNSSSSSWSTTESPDASNVQHLLRTCYVSEIGDVGTLTLTIDGTGLHALPVGHNLDILIGDDGDLTSGGPTY